MINNSLTNYSVAELNSAIATLLKRGFPPCFCLHASVLKAQVKKGHLWLTLTDGKASINAVIWASIFQNLSFKPNEGDGVVVVGKINFWETRATVTVHVLDVRPSISTVLHQFEVVRDLLLKEGLIDPARSRELPRYPRSIAVLTSVPSSALADMIRTAKERWPLTNLFVIPIPVQGAVAQKIQSVLKSLTSQLSANQIEVLVLARGGGSREDLMVFDNEDLCRQLADYPIPVVTGIGHEDDLTVADLVVDHRAATPTAAIVKVLPSRETAKDNCLQRKVRLIDYCELLVKKRRHDLLERKKALSVNSPLRVIDNYRIKLEDKNQLLKALSPQRWLARGFAIVRTQRFKTIRKIEEVKPNQHLTIELIDGLIDSEVQTIYLKKKSK